MVNFLKALWSTDKSKHLSERPKQTSCSGYVQKRSRFLHTWKSRYLVIDGEDCVVRYYESKSSFENNGKAVTCVKYNLIEATKLSSSHSSSSTHPHFAFKVTGHELGKTTSVELIFAVDNVKDQQKWISVGGNVLERKANPGHGKTLEVRRQELLGPSKQQKKKNATTTAGPDNVQLQIQNHEANTHALMKHALRDVVEAHDIGNAVASELATQDEMLRKAEDDLIEAAADMSRGDRFLKKMEKPMLHIHKVPGASKKTKDGGGETSDSTLTSPSSSSTSNVTIRGDTGGCIIDDADLNALSAALSDLKAQADEIGTAADSSIDAINRITNETEEMQSGLISQVGRAKDIMQKGTIF